MTALADPVQVTGRRAWSIAVPPAISLVTLIVLSLVITVGWGAPERFLSEATYRGMMDAAVLLRLGPVFFSGLLVWPAMRLRGASVPWAIIGTLSSAVAFGVIGAIGALMFFPVAQALYYIANPMVVAAVGAQVGWIAVGEVIVRWRRGELSALTTRMWIGLVALAGAGFLLLYAGVIWDGGRHVFYVWIRGFMWIFGTGQ